MRRCSGCPNPLPEGRKLYLCRDCARRYMWNRRNKGTERRDNPHRAPGDVLYCGTCGYRLEQFEVTCCDGARLCPPVSWRWWSADQWRLVLAMHGQRVRPANSVRLELGWTWNRLFRVARRLKSENAALLSPVLFIANDMGRLLVLTTRAMEARTCAEGLALERRLSGLTHPSRRIPCGPTANQE